jgi:regulator of sigma E protease
VRNISGPISIAQYAGHSAAIGLAPFLAFLAIVSISLGILNLLPIPILDGGHLMYYLMEFIKGSPVSEQTQLLGQRVGIIMLLLLMGLAFYNDLARLFG